MGLDPDAWVEVMAGRVAGTVRLNLDSTTCTLVVGRLTLTEVLEVLVALDESRVAEALGLPFVDSGLMYRAITRLAAERGIDPHDSDAVAQLAESTEIKLDGERVWADGVELTDGIYDSDHAEALPLISAIPGVREALVAQQRRMGRTGVVMAGRDIGTVVFRDADHKFFLVASLDEKVRRRAAQYERRGERVDHEAMRKEVEERDRQWVAALNLPNVPLDMSQCEMDPKECGLSLEDQRELLRCLQALAEAPDEVRHAQYADTDRVNTALLRLLVIDLALRSYRATHRSYPDELGSLIPEYFGALPLDPFTEAGFFYQRQFTDRFVLYSTGPGLVNHGATFGPWPLTLAGQFDLCLDTRDYESSCCELEAPPRGLPGFVLRIRDAWHRWMN